MSWNWQRPDWQEFTYDAAALEPLERQFLLHSGEFIGAFKHIGQDDKDTLKIELISDEALKTSEIEGEILNRDSVQSSLRQQFGLGTDPPRVPPAERGIAEMMVDLYRGFADPLAHETMFAWHNMVMSGHRGRSGRRRLPYRRRPMQVASGGLHNPKVHFEAPPSSRMNDEMEAFVAWFNETAPIARRAFPH